MHFKDRLLNEQYRALQSFLAQPGGNRREEEQVESCKRDSSSYRKEQQKQSNGGKSTNSLRLQRVESRIYSQIMDLVSSVSELENRLQTETNKIAGMSAEAEFKEQQLGRKLQISQQDSILKKIKGQNEELERRCKVIEASLEGSTPNRLHNQLSVLAELQRRQQQMIRQMQQLQIEEKKLTLEVEQVGDQQQQMRINLTRFSRTDRANLIQDLPIRLELEGRIKQQAMEKAALYETIRQLGKEYRRHLKLADKDNIYF